MDQSIFWIVSVVVPCVAMIGYWLVARRQVSRATAHMRAELDQQRQIVARVSHRLRDSLTVVYGFSETLIDTTLAQDTEEVIYAASMVNAEALDVSRTVEDLVAANEVDTDELHVRHVDFDPSDEIERAVTPFRRLGSPISVEAWSGPAKSDPLRFRHVVQSLVSNAVRYGGSQISVYADLDGDWFRCTVADDGSGLPDDLSHYLFGTPSSSSRSISDEGSEEGKADSAADPRGSSDPPPPLIVDAGPADSLGLGLTVAINIARRLDGTLTYERATDFAAFTLSLPINDWPGPLEPLHPPIADNLVPVPQDETAPVAEDTPIEHLPTVTFADMGTSEMSDEDPTAVESGDRGVSTT